MRSYLYSILICLFLASLIAVPFVLANDPNTPIIPPKPGVENISVVDSETLRITTSVDIKKSTLIARKEKLLRERKRINKQIAIIDKQLERFKEDQ